MKSNQSHPIPAVRAIIRNEKNEILLLQRAMDQYGAGRWCLPGGKIDYGFSAEESLVKELFEETSLKCDDYNFLFYLETMPSEKDNTHYLTLYFDCMVSGELELNRESMANDWVGSNILRNYEIAFGNDLALKKYFAMINEQ